MLGQLVMIKQDFGTFTREDRASPNLSCLPTDEARLL
jgi:hypothetical protein